MISKPLGLLRGQVKPAWLLKPAECVFGAYFFIFPKALYAHFSDKSLMNVSILLFHHVAYFLVRSNFL